MFMAIDNLHCQCNIEKHTCHSLNFLDILKEGEINVEASSGVKVGIIDRGRSIKKQSADEFNVFTKVPHLNIKHDCKDLATMGVHGYLCASILAGKMREVDFFNHVKGKQIKGVVPSADLHMYGFGCDTCSHRDDCIGMLYDIMDAVPRDGIRIVSISMGVESIRYDLKTLELFKSNVLIVNSAGNDGSRKKIKNGMAWDLTVGACTSGKTVRPTIEIGAYKEVPIDIKILGTELDEKGKKINIVSMFKGVGVNILEIGFRKLMVPKVLPRGANKAILRYQPESSDFISLDPLTDSHPYFSDVLAVNSSGIDMAIDEKQCHQILKLMVDIGRYNLLVRISKGKFYDDERGVQVPLYSSRGPPLNHPEIIKPDLIAPGHAILASLPTDIPIVKSTTAWDELYSSQSIGSGTSFSTPYVAGLASILHSLRPSWAASALESALITTEGDETMTYEAQVGYYDRSLDERVDITIEPDRLSFKAKETKEFKMKVFISPRSTKRCVYLSWV